MQTAVEQVASLRAQLWDSGFRPIPVYNPDVAGPSPGKRPCGEEWQIDARRDPPLGAIKRPRPDALNTGILCDGLRAIDIDIDNPTLAHRCRALAIGMFGEAPIRTRRNSSRCLLLYRAAEGAPPKASVAGTSGKVEVLGLGQQFVAFGRHHEGADLEWTDAPGEEFAQALPAVTEDAVAAYLTACAPIIGAKPPKARNGHDHSPGEPQADPLRIAAALADIPNAANAADWDAWNKIGMAIWRATGGSAAGFEAFNAWSARNASYDATTTRERWNGYASSPPTEIGAGTIFHLAQDARMGEQFREPGLDGPPPEVATDAGYWESVQKEAAMSAAEWDALSQRQSGRSIPATPEAHARAGEALWAITEPWNATAIPLRPWIAGGYLMRRSLTVLSGPGSAGKSSLMVAWAATLALGCAFHRMRPMTGALRVATYNVEDDADEQKRRFSAFLQRLGLAPDAFAGNLAILGPNHVGTLLHTARDGALLINTPVMDRLEAFIADFKPDILILDPFVEMHGAEENDNTAVRAVLARLRAMAVEHNMAIVILHHSRKGAAGEPGDPESLRGASSIVGAARIVLTVNVMTKDEALSFGLSPERRRNFFRLDGAKNNYAPIEDAEWFERIEVRLDNGGEISGDGVAVAWPWHPPSVWASVPPASINELMDAIAKGPSPGQFYSPSNAGKSNDRSVFPLVISMLHVNETQAKTMIKSWMNSGLLRSQTYQTSDFKPAKGLVVDDTHRPTE